MTLRNSILLLTLSLFACNSSTFSQQFLRLHDYVQNGNVEQYLTDFKSGSEANPSIGESNSGIPENMSPMGTSYIEPELQWNYRNYFGEIGETNTGCNEVCYLENGHKIVTAGKTIGFVSFIVLNPDTGEELAITPVTSLGFGINTQFIYDMTVDNDGNILAVGGCGSGSNPNYFDILLVKYDPVNYDTIWAKPLAMENGFYMDYGTGVTVDSDNNIIVSAVCETTQPGNIPTCGVFKLNTNGDLLWEKFFGDMGAGYHVITDDNSNIYVDADIISPYEASFFKLDPDGNEIWSNGTSSVWNNPLWAYNLTLGSDGKLFACGFSHPDTTTTGKDFAVGQVDSQSGEWIWINNSINGYADTSDYCHHLVYDETTNTVCGAGTIVNELDINALFENICIAGYDASNGEKKWEYNFDGNPDKKYAMDHIYDIVLDPSGYVVATGEAFDAFYSYGTPTPTLPTMQDWFTVKLDIQNGDVQWLYLLDEQLQNFPDAIGPQVGASVDVNPSNGNVFNGGYIFNYTNSTLTHEYTVLKFSNTAVNISEKSGINDLPVNSFPNPFSEEISINFRLQLPEHAHIVIKNTEGKTIRTLHNGKLSAGDHSIKWDGKNSCGKLLPNGMYFCSLIIGDQTHATKIILQR